MYLSPMLRTALYARTAGVVHNPYKSDVFSLVEIASLEEPTFFLWEELGQGEIDRVVDSLQYSKEFREMMESMLRVDEAQRGDFLQFEQWLAPVPLTSPLIDLAPTQSYPQVAPPPPNSCPANTNRLWLSPLCLHCFRPVDRFASDSQYEVVQLECDPERHILFPSRFVAWELQLEKGTAECPKCGMTVSIDVFESYRVVERTEPNEGKETQRGTH